MTDDPLAQLREQLVRAGDRRAELRVGAAPRRRLRGRRRGVWLTLAALLVVAPTVAAATGIVGFGQSAETQGRKIAFQALTDTTGLPACARSARDAAPVLSEGAPLPAITAALPVLATAAPRGEQARAAASLPPRGGTVLRRTLRAISTPGGVRLTVFVQSGDGGAGELRDPAACAQARRDRAAQLGAARSEAVRRWAARRLGELRDTVPGLQTLWVLAHVKGAAGTGGAGSPVRPRERLRPGLLLSGSAGRGRDVYVGLADPRATVVRLRAKHAGHGAGVPARAALAHGLWVAVLPRGTGPIAVRELAVDGTLLRASMLRD